MMYAQAFSMEGKPLSSAYPNNDGQGFLWAEVDASNSGAGEWWIKEWESKEEE